MRHHGWRPSPQDCIVTATGAPHAAPNHPHGTRCAKRRATVHREESRGLPAEDRDVDRRTLQGERLAGPFRARVVPFLTEPEAG